MAECILITSGRGGAGKSTVCGYVGAALARVYGRRVLLVEAGRHSLDVLLGLSDRVVYDLGDVQEERCSLRDALLKPEGLQNIAMLAAPFEEGFLPGEALFYRLEREFRGEFDYIFVEAPGNVQALAAPLSVCSRAVIVAEADPVSARECRVVSERLASLGISVPRLCINRLPELFSRKRPVPDLDYMIDTVCAQLISVILLDPLLPTLLGVGEMTSLSKTTATIFDNFAQRIIGRDIDLLVQ